MNTHTPTNLQTPSPTPTLAALYGGPRDGAAVELPEDQEVHEIAIAAPGGWYRWCARTSEELGRCTLVWSELRLAHPLQKGGLEA